MPNVSQEEGFRVYSENDFDFEKEWAYPVFVREGLID